MMRGMMMNPDKKAGMLMTPPGIVMIICMGGGLFFQEQFKF